MDKVASLQAFVKVVETGSFSEAGRQLRLSRSAISKYVGDLEGSLGVQLLNRTTRHASPNENGQLYFERALVILSEIDAADQAVTHLQSAPRGLLRINAPMSFGTLRLGPALADFMQMYPDLQLQLVLSDDLVDPVQDGFDVTLRIADLESSSLIARKITPMPRVICASPDYLEKHGAPSHPRDLRDHVSLTYGFLLTGNQWKLTGADGEHWIQPAWSLCVNNAEVLRDVAVSGRGIALIPEFIAADALRKGGLKTILKDFWAPPLTLYAIYPPTRHLSVKVRLFIDFLVQRFGREVDAQGN
ncbi:DNA-binding transcriptional LysR family regulator [Bradyrhizobium japonicum]|jgi:DNA-binding transcriptional LysR family regulator|uniref:DNA-binding transcriptional LysR family regulator n=1 Tax=Bradyrhizobium elkanii TaxID=29448 RepID=A0ABV4FCP5_BRAEL|nr:LysR family transcriptional regulator [Bradyrhizobium elkanii]MBP2431871.1 DNA-binding transcriptional LysR family regulator [Bradyrhizobium elkanii]MCP1735057.1 DNA-binding transcriptional LysR family regulator [Bradyrhizobium elkanii]MCP1752600.1 DNA-binding transcriptional LysR family regulator [Bradyrhizobium elkanii]MCP1978373.1 DNA-binding transcriptional LysR family regulator [Bradyrhizobium elkanii]MCS3570396.1 DNA-binding transcriptional LysR family regulator [Bradyrhizobium elkani